MYNKNSIGAKPANAMIAAYGELHGRLEGRCGTDELARRVRRVTEFADGVNPEIRRLHHNLSRNVADVELILMGRDRKETLGEGEKAAVAIAPATGGRGTGADQPLRILGNSPGFLL